MRRNGSEADTYVSVSGACAHFEMSRSTFYRMLRDPESHLDRIIIRVPPLRGRIRVPLKRFEKWLRDQSRGGGGWSRGSSRG